MTDNPTRGSWTALHQKTVLGESQIALQTYGVHTTGGGQALRGPVPARFLRRRGGTSPLPDGGSLGNAPEACYDRRVTFRPSDRVIPR